MDAWRLAGESCRLHRYPGGHFFAEDGDGTAALSREVGELVAEPAGRHPVST